ncbi:MAG: ProQ/FINO family protein [Gammaproteobacteria bacterium]|nr:ProQ/FINO family protein [Gammaproteobacteria bacterium]
MKSEKITLAHINTKKTQGSPIKQGESLQLLSIPSHDTAARDVARLKRNAEVKLLKQLLYEKNTNIFNANNPVPLAIGMHKEIKTSFPQFSQKLIREFLSQWVKSTKYLNTIVSCETRYNLQGGCCSTISDDEKKFASTIIVKRTQKKYL